MPIIDAIVYTILFIGCVALSAIVIKQKRKQKSLYDDIIRLTVDKQLLLEKLGDAFSALESKPLEQSDGFVQYLEATRDSAFSFIEVVQKSITQFDQDTAEIFAKQRLSEDVKKIKLAYQQLKQNTLPNDVPNN